MRILVLDDNEERHLAFKKRYAGHDVKHVYKYHDCIDELVRGGWDLVHLDHDLADEVFDADETIDASGHQRFFTGVDVANWLLGCPSGMIPKCIIVHSTNPVGGAAMHQTLARAGFNCLRQPFLT